MLRQVYKGHLAQVVRARLWRFARQEEQQLLELPVDAWTYLEQPAKPHRRRWWIILAAIVFSLGLLGAELFLASPCETLGVVVQPAIGTPIPSVNDRDFPHLLPTPTPTPTPKPTPRPTPAPVRLGWPLCIAGTITQYFHAGHYALDVSAPCGTRVLASLNATVVWAGWKNNGGGLVVDLSTGVPPTEGYPGRTGWFLSYNHLSKVLVHVGQKVVKGQVVGLVGHTGWSTGCHLHFMVARNGVWLNPLAYMD